MKRKKISQSDLFAFQLKCSKIYFVREFRFDDKRRWRSDFYIPASNLGQADILVEIEGGTFIGGAHTRGVHYQSDVEKYNEAVLRGYILLRGTSDDVKTGRLLQWIERAIAKFWP